MKKIIATLLCMFVFPAYAETMYVTERLATSLRAATADGSAVVKTVESGSALEVLEHVDKFARVRDAQGAEGWIETRLLSNTPPARAQLERNQVDLAKVRVDLTAAQARIAQLETKLAQETARGAELAQSADQAKSKTETTRQTATNSPVPGNEADFSWGWLVLAFAMLWLGFGAGVVWLRERNRKRMGGMYLRI